MKQKSGSGVTNYRELDDQTLVSKTLKGDDHAFAEIIRRHQHTVARTVTGMLGNSVDAEDVGQQVFIRLYRALGDFRGEAMLSTYITRIAINLSINELRRKKKFSQWFKSLGDVTDKTNQELQLHEQNNSNDLNEIILKALDLLEPDFRSVVVLRLIEGYSTKETAEMLNIPLGTVLSRLSRAQEKLKKILQPFT